MLGLMEVLGGVLVLGRVTAANMTADEAFPQMNPGIAHLQALLAAFATGFDLTNFFYMRTSRLCAWHASPLGFPLCTFVSFVVNEFRLLAPQKAAKVHKGRLI